ncbi:hypothetical protein TNCV_2708411 [Trichonephila clavipes]|nr:hypothetical protein TNCV_2708411 [Trichonephila clavipes]
MHHRSTNEIKAHEAVDSTIFLGSTPISGEDTQVVRGLPPSSLSTNITRGLAARRLLRVSPCPEGTLYIYKHPYNLQGFEPVQRHQPLYRMGGKNSLKSNNNRLADEAVNAMHIIRHHAFRLVKSFLEAETIQLTGWIACSPDLNPIQRFWNTFGKYVAARTRPPFTSRTGESDLDLYPIKSHR